jgi:hypothetical protein
MNLKCSVKLKGKGIAKGKILVDLQISYASILKIRRKPECNNNPYQLFQNLHRISIYHAKTAKEARDLWTII